MKNFSKEKQDNVDEIMKHGADKIRNIALRNVPVNEGFLKNSISVNRIKEGYEVGVQSNYAAFVEFGTKSGFHVDSEFANYAAQFKGQKGTGGDMYQSILDWVRLKNIKFARTRTERKQRQAYLTPEQTAFIIMNSILRKGIEAQPYLLPAFVQVRKEMIDQIIQELRA